MVVEVELTRFHFFKRGQSAEPARWYANASADSLLISRAGTGDWRIDASPLLAAWLSQLEDEGFCTRNEAGFAITWAALFELLSHPDHRAAVPMLALPRSIEARPNLLSRDSLEDESFSIAIDGWCIGDSRIQDAKTTGALLLHNGERGLLKPEVWALVSDIRAFASREPAGRTAHAHRLAWGRIRRLAVAANANLDAFLSRSVVLTPEKLTIGIRKAAVADDTIMEIQPTFDGAPANWLTYFDKYQHVRSRYDISTNDGVVQVVIAPKVRTVLDEIKRLPNRRVAGARAQAFILNPYAALGEDATAVIDEDQFERARASAGFEHERFLPQFERDHLGYPTRVGLLVETASTSGPTFSETIWLDDALLEKFVTGLRKAINQAHLLFPWDGYDLALLGDTPEHLAELEQALQDRRHPPVLINYVDVYDLTNYASRIQEIGFEKPYYSPFIAKKRDDEGWFPDNIIQIIAWAPGDGAEIVSMPIGPDGLAKLKQKVSAARVSGKSTIDVPGVPTSMPVSEAERIAATFDMVFEDTRRGTFTPTDATTATGKSPSKRKSPVVMPNIAAIDYAEERLQALSSEGRTPAIPASLRPDCSLLPHQLTGLSWLQTLFEARTSFNCRGAVLADDMGLGKTLQILTLIAWAIERDPSIDPVLVVAPVSLLENWKEEAHKFFRKESLSILTAYGDDLAGLRVPSSSIDARLRDEDGLTKFLRPGCFHDSDIVLTTYETLRDLEFSFATQRWSMMICDEAQKIKNPAAMVTRAAKKQNVAFKLACTGTPVENTLADLWCLFDFVQPGLLGALNDFGHRYRKPIEAKTDEEKARVEELRDLIKPQILRRTKDEVARDLPKKIVVEECRALPLSSAQRELYGRAIESFRRRNEPGANSPFKNHLGLLHYLRLICTDPRRYGLDVFKPEPLALYRTRAPKLDWLLSQLAIIAEKGEKAIVFCEFRNIQRLLQHYIEEDLGIRPDIINGDTVASASHINSRHKRIRAFQEKVGFGVIILSPVAVGFGVNIQAANHVIHYTRTWNPAKEDQATDRAYRIGQTKDVYVYYPVVHADDFKTFDVKLDRLLELKRDLARDMLNGSGDLKPGEFDLDEVTPSNTSVSDETVTLDAVLAMNWEYFEALAAVLYAKRGYDTFRTPSSKDNGIDVVALPRLEPTGKLVQAKTSASDNAALCWDAVKEVVAGHAFYAKQFPLVRFDRVCITNQYFDQQTHLNAELNDVELIEQPRLAAMLNETPVRLLEIEQVLYTDWSQAQ